MPYRFYSWLARCDPDARAGRQAAYSREVQQPERPPSIPYDRYSPFHLHERPTVPPMRLVHTEEVTVGLSHYDAPAGPVKRQRRLARVHTVMQLGTAAELELPSWLSAAIGHAISWRSAIFVLAVLII